MRTFEVYLTDSKRPVWTYKTSKGFYARLRALAALRSLVSVKVLVAGIGNQWYQVHLNPEPDVQWSSERLYSKEK
jgi:hypothetical protein